MKSTHSSDHGRCGRNSRRCGGFERTTLDKLTDFLGTCEATNSVLVRARGFDEYRGGQCQEEWTDSMISLQRLLIYGLLNWANNTKRRKDGFRSITGIIGSILLRQSVLFHILEPEMVNSKCANNRAHQYC